MEYNNNSQNDNNFDLVIRNDKDNQMDNSQITKVKHFLNKKEYYLRCSPGQLLKKKILYNNPDDINKKLTFEVSNDIIFIENENSSMYLEYKSNL